MKRPRVSDTSASTHSGNEREKKIQRSSSGVQCFVLILPGSLPLLFVPFFFFFFFFSFCVFLSFFYLRFLISRLGTVPGRATDRSPRHSRQQQQKKKGETTSRKKRNGEREGEEIRKREKKMRWERMAGGPFLFRVLCFSFRSNFNSVFGAAVSSTWSAFRSSSSRLRSVSCALSSSPCAFRVSSSLYGVRISVSLLCFSSLPFFGALSAIRLWIFLGRREHLRKTYTYGLAWIGK
jgi:hypothetical protein